MKEEQRDALQAIRDLAPRAADALARLMDDPKTPPSVRLQCIQVVLDRTYGKPEARVAIGAEPDFTALHEAFAAMKVG